MIKKSKVSDRFDLRGAEVKSLGRVLPQIHLSAVVVCQVDSSLWGLYVLHYLLQSDTLARVDHFVIFPEKGDHRWFCMYDM